YTCALEDDIRINFYGAQRCCGICSKIGVTSTRSEYYNTPFFEMAHRTSPDKGFANLLHFDRRQQTCFEFYFLHTILKSHALDNGGTRPRSVCFSAAHAAFFGAKTTIDIATADDDSDFHALRMDFFNILGILSDTIDVNSIILVAHEGFSAEFE